MPHANEERLPREVRPLTYATFELLLDVVHTWRGAAPSLDLETLLICIAVNEAAMRRFLVGPEARPDLIDHPAPPDDVRGSISRHAIADRLDLSRETVRRKVNQLIEIGLLVEDAQGEVRPVQRLADPAVQKAAEDSLSAVRRFDKRLRSLGCEGV